ncbi:MAG: Gfo/Idh/MocA family oxidoreductase [bacterium]|nr:Gfo/Idh/MocA family oxidoreductase [bacterium]
MTTDTVRWGILGTGAMARTFAADLKFARGAELLAVASRTQDKADAFGEALGIPRRYEDYVRLVDDPDVDVVYIATPNNMHKDQALMALDGGKAVLCEKPFAMNASEARTMVAHAREKRLFLMEAMWTRFLPVMGKLRELVSSGALGDVRMVTADFGFRADGEDLAEILTSPEYGGGSLLDVGVYPVSLASMILGSPTTVAGLAHLGGTGVDEQAGMVLGNEDGQLAILHSAIRTTTPQDAVIMGTEKHVRIHAPFWRGSALTITGEDESEETVEAPFEGDGYHFEAVEVMECLRQGRLESAIMPLGESVAVMETLDRLRAQWGLRFPADPVK